MVFKFETIKSGLDVNQVRVAINVQEGFYLKGGKGQTQYQPPIFSALESTSALKGVEDSSIRSFSQNIIYQSGYVKQTSGLDPWESFTVAGKYSSSRFLLYLNGIFISIAVIIGIIFGVWFLVKKFRKKISEKAPALQSQSGVIRALIWGAIGACGALAVIFGGNFSY